MFWVQSVELLSQNLEGEELTQCRKPVNAED